MIEGNSLVFMQVFVEVVLLWLLLDPSAASVSVMFEGFSVSVMF